MSAVEIRAVPSLHETMRATADFLKLHYDSLATVEEMRQWLANLSAYATVTGIPPERRSDFLDVLSQLDKGTKS
jgi:hypothetical protein